MSSYTSSAKQFTFPKLPDNGGNTTKQAYIFGFVKAVADSQLSSVEKVAWLKYAAGLPPGGPAGGPPDAGGPGADPGAGPGPGFVPEGGDPSGGDPGAGGDDAMVQQIYASLPGESTEEKLHSAILALVQIHSGDQGGVEPGGLAGGPGGVESGGMGGPGGDGGGAGGPGGPGGMDPALLQQLMAAAGPGAGGPGAGGPGAGGPPPS